MRTVRSRKKDAARAESVCPVCFTRSDHSDVIRAAVSAEREACATVADNAHTTLPFREHQELRLARKIAKAIRARETRS